MFTVYGQPITFTSPMDSIGRYAIEANKPKVFEDAVKMIGASTSGGAPVAEVGAKDLATQPADGETVRTALPLIKANLSGIGQIEPGSVQMRVSGLGVVPATYDPKTGAISYQVTQKLREKSCSVFVTAKSQGKKVEAHWTFGIEESPALALLEADVDFQVAKKFIGRVKEKALGETVLRSIRPGQQIVKIFHDELSALLGGDAAPLHLEEAGRILIVGLNGSGKTTSSAKLALFLKKQGHSPALIACDLQRPAAIEQLATLARQIEVPAHTPDPNEKNVLRAAAAALGRARPELARRGGGAPNIDIFDTAGRQEIDDALIQELKELKEFLQPEETLLVVDAATGQQAVSVATHFNDALEITG